MSKVAELFDITGRVAVVTGGASGIGKAIALDLARFGAIVVIADAALGPAEQVARDIRNVHGNAIAVRTDVTSRGEVDALVEKAVGEFGRIDILVNSAGIIRPAGLLDMAEDEWDAVMNVNLKGVFLVMQAVARHMVREKYGKIINIASTCGLNTVAGPVANYAPSKAGVIQLTKVAATELGPYGINVNAIAPGPITTELHYEGRTPDQVEEYFERSRKAAVLGRIGSPEDIANVALFLATDESSLITGQVIAADGGKTGLL